MRLAALVLCLIAAATLAGCTTDGPSGVTAVDAVQAPPAGWWGQPFTIDFKGTPGGAARLHLDGAPIADIVFDTQGGSRITVDLPRPGALVFTAGAHDIVVESRVAHVHLAAPDSGRGQPDNKTPSSDPVPDGYDHREVTLHGTRVVVAYASDLPDAYKGEPVYDIDAMTARLAAAFDHHWHVFHGFTHDTMTWVFEHPDTPCEEERTATYYRVCGQAPTPSTMDDWATHEMFHAWNQGVFVHGGDGPGILQAESWLAEGATVYYTARAQTTPTDVRGYTDMMRHAADVYRQAQGGALDQPFADLAAMTEPAYPGGPPQGGPHVDMIYLKGALVAQAMDARLAKAGHDLDYLMAWLYDGGRGRAYENPDLQAGLERLTGEPWMDFFDGYIHGTAPVPTQLVFVDHVHGAVLPLT